MNRSNSYLQRRKAWIKSRPEETRLKAILDEAGREHNNIFNNLPSGLDFHDFEAALEETGEKVAQASRNYRMKKHPEYEEIVGSRHHRMTVAEFVECVHSGGFIDYDGSGEYVWKNYRTGIDIIPSDVKHGAVRKDFKEILWFNR